MYTCIMIGGMGCGFDIIKKYNIGDIDVNAMTIIAITVFMLWHYHSISFCTCINSCVYSYDEESFPMRKSNNSLHNCLPGVIPLHSLYKFVYSY